MPWITNSLDFNITFKIILEDFFLLSCDYEILEDSYFTSLHQNDCYLLLLPTVLKLVRDPLLSQYLHCIL